ncbi:uncharacterized protein LA080_009712 [Diaporthe eres]|nr:uncharacterized protein LA080_009712 [Diaporthe eres]
MATSALTNLPTELLDEIILHSLPEGFEGLALTCRKLYNLCTPSIEYHNQLRKRFRKFTYTKYTNNGLLSVNNPLSDNLIREIAHNHIVARYIRHADFTYDTWPTRASSRPVRLLPDPDLGRPVAALFAESPYLREAGLDWREYYALIQEDLGSPGRYSQHAAAFLLTLLANVTSMELPCLWRRCEMTDRLIRATVRRAVNRPSPSSPLWDRPSLAQVSELDLYNETGPLDHKFELARAGPLLSLPNLQAAGHNTTTIELKWSRF